jgi:hypothetical protein
VGRSHLLWLGSSRAARRAAGSSRGHAKLS